MACQKRREAGDRRLRPCGSHRLAGPPWHHVNLKTSRLDEMIAWYGTVIGAKVQFRNQIAAWTTNDEANHRIAFLAVPGLSDDEQKTKHNGVHHCAFECDSFDDLMTSFDRLRKAGIDPAFCLDHGITFAAWTTNDEANHRIAFLAVPGLSDDEQKTKHNGMHHCAFECDSFDDLMTSFDRLRKAGIDPAFCLDHGITISLYYRDPEGNFVELQSDVFGDWAKSGDFMRTSPDFAANPIGTFFDPARVYAALKLGADLKTLQSCARSTRRRISRVS